MVPLLLAVEHELTPSSVLAVNRRSVFVGYIVIDYIFGSLALEPKNQQNAPIPMELRNLVKEKIKSQDTVSRAHLLSINWTIEDELTVRLIYRDRPVETVSQMPQFVPISNHDLLSMFCNC